ncbi:MAG: NlpC/P60 family protein [Pontixanthobacter sp.]
MNGQSWDMRAIRFGRSAEALVGTPFKLYGRNAAVGLDCVGVVVNALANAGLKVPQLPEYSLRNLDDAPFIAATRNANFEPCDTNADVAAGDLLMVAPGTAQAHLLIAVSGGGLVHAHAGLRRVVRMPGPCPWPLRYHFRLRRARDSTSTYETRSAG